MYNEIVDDRMVIYLEDDLVAPNVKGFNEHVDQYFEEDVDLDEVVLNLGSVKNIDSIGVTFVISLYKNVMKDGMGFIISDASDNVKQLFKLMKLDDLLE
jgi:anti-anti-sigma factor